jgi:hypothetical protein
VSLLAYVQTSNNDGILTFTISLVHFVLFVDYFTFCFLWVAHGIANTNTNIETHKPNVCTITRNQQLITFLLRLVLSFSDDQTVAELLLKV